MNAVLAGRRNSPPDPEIGLPPLAVYSPIHYQELPELFMEFISSLTGKSPSTTGFGSEGALTKAPFNALWPVVDLNNALAVRDPHRLRRIHDLRRLCGAPGARGPRHQHARTGDLVPHASPRARSTVHDFRKNCSNVSKILLSAGGRFSPADWDIASLACLSNAFWAGFSKRRMWSFPEEMLRPEKQSLELFAAGVDAIVEAQRRVALNYFEDGSVDSACPPLKALLHIMAHGEYEGMGLERLRNFVSFLIARWCSKAVGIRNGFASSKSATLPCGAATWQLSENSKAQAPLSP